MEEIKQLGYVSKDFFYADESQNTYSFLEFDNSVEKMIKFLYERIDESDYNQ